MEGNSLQTPQQTLGGLSGIGGSTTLPPTDSKPQSAQMDKTRSIQDEEIQLKLLKREREYSNPQDARFFAEVAEYIDLLQLEVSRNKKYRMDAEERERIVAKGFTDREMRYGQEMRDLEE